MKELLKKSLMFGGLVALFSIIYNLFIKAYEGKVFEIIAAGVVINFVIFTLMGFFIYLLFNKNKLNILLSNIFLVIGSFISIWIAPNNVGLSMLGIFSITMLGKLIIANIAFVLTYFILGGE